MIISKFLGGIKVFDELKPINSVCVKLIKTLLGILYEGSNNSNKKVDYLLIVYTQEKKKISKCDPESRDESKQRPRT